MRSKWAGIMAWEILWALILDSRLFAVIRAVVSKEEMSRLLPDDSLRTIALACGLGADHDPGWHMGLAREHPPPPLLKIQGMRTVPKSV